MKVAELSVSDFARRLRRGELLLDIAPFVARLRSGLPRLAQELQGLYADFELLPPERFADFHLEVRREPGLRGWLRPQARFFYDGQPAFLPLPAPHGPVMVEWGLNWCVASHAHQYLVIHAAVLARGEQAVVLPAPPGSGKSTLCAALMHHGWRLLSDELGLLDMPSGLLRGMARPVNLKNDAIALIQAFAPASRFGTPIADTTKGRVALLAPPPDSVRQRRVPARPAWVVLPRYEAGAATSMTRCDKARAMILLAEQSFNYHVHGEAGFDALTRLVDEAQCLEFRYSRLDEAMAAFDALCPRPEPAR